LPAQSVQIAKAILEPVERSQVSRSAGQQCRAGGGSARQ